MKTLSLSLLAKREINAAVDYYCKERPGLETGFLDAVYEAFDAVQKNPEAFGRYDEDTRMKRTSHFPYVVFYHETPNEIVIITVAHTARRPGYWKDDGSE